MGNMVLDKEAKMQKKKEKQGLMIGFITNGMVSVKWMMRLNEMQHGIPSGMFWKYCWYEGKGYKDKGGYAKARTKVVEQARAHNAKWLLFIDCDVLPQPDVITSLMSHSKDIVTGIYYMKSSPAQPVIFKKMGDGPYWDYPINELFEIEGSGMGLCLINMDVFDKFEEAGIPFFKENWVYEKPDGSKVKVKVGEDHWFFIQAKKLGYKIYCDSSVSGIADHIDSNTGVSYPGEEEVSRIRKKLLQKEGQEKIIEKEEKLFSVDQNKKTIVFYNATPSEFAGDELERRGVGGSEGDIINLSKIFAKYYNVIVFCNCPRPGIYDGVRYMHVGDTEYLKKIKTDLFIASRNTHLLAEVNFKEMFNIDKVCLWTHDLPESYVFDKLPKAIPNIDRIFALTRWHRDEIKKKFPDVPDKYWFNARNGVDTELYKVDVKRNPYKLIYSSTPFRGLDVLLEVFPKIKEQVPKAELHVFSSMKVYGNATEDEDKKFQKLYDKAEDMDGVVYHGSVTRKELAKHMKESAVMTYPNHYKETMCISAAEAIVAGTPIVTSKLAALPEVIPPKCATFIDGDAHSERYKKWFISSVVEILKNPKLWQKMHKACKGHDFSWETISLEWIQEFFPDDLEDFNNALDDHSHKLPAEKKRKHKKKIKSDTEKEHRLKLAEEKGWDKKLVKYREEHGGNLNTAEYWDSQYKYEFEKGIDQRSSSRRWNIILDYIKDDDVVLDYGCSMGEFLVYLGDKKPNTKRYGIDMSKFALEKAHEKDNSLRLTNSIDGLLPDCKENYFDVISGQHVIEHFDDPVELIEDMRKLLTKDGTLILVIPLNDDWIEHQTVWKMEDIVELLNRFDCTYKLIHRKKTIRDRDDGKPVEEVIAIIQFGG